MRVFGVEEHFFYFQLAIQISSNPPTVSTEVYHDHIIASFSFKNFMYYIDFILTNIESIWNYLELKNSCPTLYSYVTKF